jgi:hypothetical protein
MKTIHETRLNRAAGASVAVVTMMLSGFTPAFALSPTKASQLVTLDISGSTTGCLGNSDNLYFDVRIRQNGNPSFGFSIPAGKVLVITSAEVEVRGPEGSGAEVRLLIGNRTNPHEGGEVSRVTAAVDAGEFGTANFQLSNGIAIAAGRSLCVQLQGAAKFFAATAHGYLAPDD